MALRTSWLASLLVFACLTGITMAQTPPPRLDIAPLSAPAEATRIPWTSGDDEGWRSGEPTFLVSESAGDGLSAKGWVASTNEHLLVRLDVTDPVHINDKSGDRIWDGDFVRISLDGRGDGACGGRPDSSGLFGPDDISIGFALTPAGPASWTYASEPAPQQSPLPAELLSFVRDEPQKLTRYDIRIPWERMRIAAGATPSFGIVVQVRSVTRLDQREPLHVRWGDGANAPQPGLFKTVALSGKAPAPIASATVVKDTIWQPSDSAEIIVAVAADQPRTIRATAGGESVSRQVAPGELSHWSVRWQPTPGGQAPTLDVNIEGTSAKASVTPLVAEGAVARLVSRIDELLSSPSHPLMQRHLRSLKAMAQAEWARLTMYRGDNIALARETMTFVQDISRGLDGPAANWNEYVAGRLPLFMAYLSRRDGTLQFYELTLPQNWDPELSDDQRQPMPLFVELHGAGNPHPLAGAAARMSQRVPGAPKIGYHIAPFGRGNSGYRDIGETDVWEAWDDIHQTVRIDDDRCYLYGFSMGGGGTWNLGSRTPDRWAAIGILGMAPNAGANVGLARNVASLPIWIWAGEQDQFAPKDRLEAFVAELRARGASPVMHTTPDVGHSYLSEKQVEVVEFLTRHQRQRPTEFAFVADTPEHRGAWGVQMNRDVAQSGAPSVAVRIDGQSVHIDSEGTGGLTVDLGPHGLRMSGDVTIVWNGKQAYQGPADSGSPIRLGEGGERGPRR